MKYDSITLTDGTVLHVNDTILRKADKKEMTINQIEGVDDGVEMTYKLECYWKSELGEVDSYTYHLSELEVPVKEEGN